MIFLSYVTSNTCIDLLTSFLSYLYAFTLTSVFDIFFLVIFICTHFDRNSHKVYAPCHDSNNKMYHKTRIKRSPQVVKIKQRFLHRNETSLVSLRLLDEGVRVQEAIYGHNYTLRAEISRPDGSYLISHSVVLLLRPVSIRTQVR